MLVQVYLDLSGLFRFAPADHIEERASHIELDKRLLIPLGMLVPPSLNGDGLDFVGCRAQLRVQPEAN